MKIRTFMGLVSYVDESVNEFLKTVDVVKIQAHPTGAQTITVVVIYKEGSGDGR